MSKKSTLVFILFLGITIQSFCQSVASGLSYGQAVQMYQAAAGVSQKPSETSLEYVNKWAKKDFAQEKDYFNFIIFCDKNLKEEWKINDPKVSFAVGKILQKHGKQHEAYGYLYRAAMLLKSAPVNDREFLIDFHESMGLSYFYFRRFKQAKEHFFQALALTPLPVRSQININNTIGLIFRDQGDNESARYYFEKALNVAVKNGNKDWVGVISGNLGYYYWTQKKYVKSRQLAETDFQISLDTEQWGSAVNALCLLIDIDVAENKLDAAAEKIKKAFELLQHDKSAGGRRAVYKSQTNFLERKGDFKGALESNKLSVAYRDTMIKEINLENFNNTEFQINFEKKQAEVSLLQAKENQHEFVIFALFIFLATVVIGFILIIVQIMKRRKRDKQILILQNLRTEEELLNTEKEMRSILNNLIEKNQLVDKLREEVELFHANQDDERSVQEKEKLFDRLQSFTLLTEDDWVEFKKLFEKLNPGFFDFLTERYPDLTNAEIRLATLIKLNLSNLEMARTLGISPDSVRKTNLRLRKKLDIEHQDELVSFIKKITKS